MHTTHLIHGTRLCRAAAFFDYAKGTSTTIGMVPRASIATYKAWWTSWCVFSDILMAFDVSIKDEFNVISVLLDAISKAPSFTARGSGSVQCRSHGHCRLYLFGQL
jgi:hypothetical protein